MKTEILSDAQWQIIEKKLVAPNRNRKYPLREIWNGLFYLLKTGCQWRMLPANYPPWTLIYYYFSKWRDTEILEEINTVLREKIRQSAGRNEQCSVGIIDSQSVKTTRKGGFRGIDGIKRLMDASDISWWILWATSLVRWCIRLIFMIAREPI